MTNAKAAENTMSMSDGRNRSEITAQYLVFLRQIGRQAK
jgi:hypothetical protein